MDQPPMRQIRAVFDDRTITVYQAYPPAIAEPAVAAGTFVAPFKLDRMTWIKPSFLWMMYRSGWATKPGQERVLAISLSRQGFEDALSRSALSHFDSALHRDHDAWKEQKDSSPVRIQWDPERSLDLQPLPWRSLQIGLGGEAARHYVQDWIKGITDVTARAHAIRDAPSRASDLLPVEEPYPLPAGIAKRIGATLPVA